MRIRRRVTIAVLLAVAAMTAGAWPFYFVSHSAGAEVLWNDKQALVFVEAANEGGALRGFQIVLDVVGALFHVQDSPTIRPAPGLVLTVTSRDVTRRLVDSSQLSTLSVFEGRVHSGALAWDGDAFQALGTEDQRRWDVERPTLPSGEFRGIDGWSKRCCFFHPDPSGRRSIDLRLDGQQLVLSSVVREDEWRIDLKRQGRETETIWRQDKRVHLVTKKEYETMFH